jgi:hypothetical protein
MLLGLFLFAILTRAPASSMTDPLLPCDIYASHATPCVAAYSLVRALYASFDGPLYQVERVDNATLDIGLLSAGGYVDSAPQDAFCQGSVTSSVPPLGSLVNLVPSSMPTVAFRHCDGVAYVNPMSYGDDFAFKIVAALDGTPHAISFESTNFPNHYIAPVDGAHPSEPGRVGVVPVAAAADASWRVSSGTAGGLVLSCIGQGGQSLALGSNLTGACAHEYKPPSVGVFLSAAAAPTSWVLDGSAGGPCTIKRIYDQSPQLNHLDVAGPGAQARSNKPVKASISPVIVGGGHRAYGARFQTGMGYRRDNTSGMALGDGAETMYMVTSNATYNDGCCFDFGNAETDNDDEGRGTMEAIYFGDKNTTAKGWCGGRFDGVTAGPWVMADVEDGIWACAAPSAQAPLGAAMNFNFVTGMLKGDGGRQWALRGGDASGGPLQPLWDGPRPHGYSPMRLQGAIILGIGGDSSHSSVGLFYEGAIVAAYTSDAADAAVHASIVQTGYQQSSAVELHGR